MRKEFVVAKCDIHCLWNDARPTYRIYVKDELFVERTWDWQNIYLEESLQIEATPGKYSVRLELVNSDAASIKMRNLRIDHGPAIIARDGNIQIYTPERPNENT